MIIKVLGTGCAKCKLLENIVMEAITQAGIQAEVIKIQEMEDIMQYDIMSTPALVINEKIVFSGRIPDINEMKEILMNEK